jgi:hypothetical protein
MIIPPTVRDNDVGHRLLEILLPFHEPVVARIATQDCPFPETDGSTTDGHNQNSWSISVLDQALSTR